MATTCSFTGCGRTHYARTLCHTHYQQRRACRELAPIVPRRPARATRERDSHGRKFCIRCDLWHPESDFVADPSHADGLSTYCKACRSAHARAWRYGLTPERIADKIHEQDGMCATCPTPLTSGYCVDHNHGCCAGVKTCGECVRGLLCQECNKILGKLESDSDRTRRLLDYIGGLTHG